MGPLARKKNFHREVVKTSSRKKELRREIAWYATDIAGTKMDLDPALEDTSLEHLMETEREPKRKKK